MQLTRPEPRPKARTRLKLVPGWWGLLPALAGMALFLGYPLIQVMGFSTLEWGGLGAGTPVGAQNYLRMTQDPELGRALLVTLGFAALTLPLYVLLSAFVAMELEGTRLERPIKALLFLPGLITVGASAISWYTLAAPEYGLISQLTGLNIPWDRSGFAALAVVAAFTLWQHLGYGVLVFSAALKNLPQEVLEAARVDGASEEALRWRIVLPLLRPSLVFLGVVGSLYALQSYTAVFLLTRGGPFGSTRVVGYYLYEVAFERYQLGYGAALSVGVLLLAFAVAAVQARRLRSEL
ncbi:multiple sugar transport system permease protein [Deinobacterium chartae]|uniref:Multiple sugar transport system permease protein n=1 Tax=Deinobacterium chartae TaxID=521158 RepID=A0A841I221_9DEIO|nr:sugar ABC transporter permease [Deinobacterium chartae]MBB6099106.1 multiple sugar transport system permease protein [Deinobacterium chartae]